MWDVRYLPEAEAEVDKLPSREQAAVRNADEKLKALGPALPFPRSSAVKETTGLRELRPRGGRSPWRAFYREVEGTFFIASVGPEAQQDKRGFRRAAQNALERLEDLEG